MQTVDAVSFLTFCSHEIRSSVCLDHLQCRDQVINLQASNRMLEAADDEACRQAAGRLVGAAIANIVRVDQVRQHGYLKSVTYTDADVQHHCLL